MDNRVRSTLVEGMRDLQNLLVHLQTALNEVGLPVLRAGGGLTFSGFSIQVEKKAPVDWIGYHLDRPNAVVFEIRDRALPSDCPFSDVRQIQTGRYERLFALNEADFFERSEREQMDLLREFIEETVRYLRGLPSEEEDLG